MQKSKPTKTQLKKISDDKLKVRIFNTVQKTVEADQVQLGEGGKGLMLAESSTGRHNQRYIVQEDSLW